MAGHGKVTRERQIRATSNQPAEELLGGEAADAVLHEVPLAFLARGAKARSVSRGASETGRGAYCPGSIAKGIPFDGLSR